MFTLYVYTNRVKSLHCTYILTYQTFALYVYTNRIKCLHCTLILTVSNIYIVV